MPTRKSFIFNLRTPLTLKIGMIFVKISNQPQVCIIFLTFNKLYISMFVWELLEMLGSVEGFWGWGGGHWNERSETISPRPKVSKFAQPLRVYDGYQAKPDVLASKMKSTFNEKLAIQIVGEQNSLCRLWCVKIRLMLLWWKYKIENLPRLAFAPLYIHYHLDAVHYLLDNSRSWKHSWMTREFNYLNK